MRRLVSRKGHSGWWNLVETAARAGAESWKCSGAGEGDWSRSLAGADSWGYSFAGAQSWPCSSMGPLEPR